MKLKHAFSLAIVLLCIFVSCQQGSPETAKDKLSQLENKLEIYDQTTTTTDTAVTGNTQFTPPYKIEEQQPQKQPAPNVDWDRKIIKTGTLDLEVKDYNKYYTALRDVVRRTGGYIATEDQNQSDYKLENILTVKVPVAQFDEVMTLMTTTTGEEKVVVRKITSQDVTGEVVDTKSRIEAKKQARLRYMELLKQAKNIGEILQVQDEINSIQEEIEMGSGRVIYLNHSAAFSTIQLTFYQVLNPSQQPQTDPSFFTKLWNSFDKGWDFIKNLVLALITIWPLWIVCLGAWYALKKWSKVRSQTSKA